MEIKIFKEMDSLLNVIRQQESITDENDIQLLIKILNQRITHNMETEKMLDDMYKEYLINRGKRE